MKYSSLALFLASLIIGSLAAQGVVPPKHFRFIPLGELPVWKEGPLDEDGVRPGINPPQGALLPNPVSILSGKATFLPFRLNLLKFTKILTLNGNTPQLLLKKGKNAAAPDWLKGKTPLAPFNLGVLYRDHKAMNWNQPKMLLLNDTPAAFPIGTVRFTNVSDIMIIVQIGDWDTKPEPTKFGVKPGKTLIKPLKVGANKMRVGYARTKGTEAWIWENQIDLLKNQRVQAFCYKAQGKKPKRPFLFHFAPESIPTPPKPRPRPPVGP